MIKQAIEVDLKKAMLAGDKRRVSVLRTVKSVILDVEIKDGVREAGLDNDKVIAVLQKEAKKRGEAAELYSTANDSERAEQELYEQAVINEYLPEAMASDDVAAIVDEVIASFDAPTPQMMGQIIGAVKAKTGAAADGAVIAGLVKARLQS